MSEIVYLGLGSNLGDREANIKTALAHLESKDIEVLKVSELIETEPVGGPSQPAFLNGVAEIRTVLPPLDLLELLKEAEVAAGRQKTGVRWGPREADLDILLYGQRIVRTPGLTVPHPRFRERQFVLEPLAGIAPDARDPQTGRTADQLLSDFLRKKSGRRTVRLLETLEQLDDYVEMAERNRFTIGLVPTMGAFHEGHLSLMRFAREECDLLIVSLFVNPTQFAPEEDLESYPRRLEDDLEHAAEAGVDVVFAPAAEEMYPPHFCTAVQVEGLSDLHCGATRPGHFKGVTTVVARLMNLVRPDVAFFGQKDYQQAVIIRRMVRDLGMPVEVQVLPTVREEDGLAMSSRNDYLSPEERGRATCIYRGLVAAKEAFDAGERTAEVLVARVRDELEAVEG
ncbi:MAG: pantoate--beta-alanine ligase, partial [Planctomycetota bacterium]